MSRAGAGHRRGESTYGKARLTKAGYAARAAEKLARRDLIPTPGSNKASRTWRRWLPDTEEIRFLKRAALTEALAGSTTDYQDELRAIGTKHQRAAHRAQQKARGKGPSAVAKLWIRVKAHRRRRPGGAK